MNRQITYDGRPCCQTIGCNEAAMPYGYVVEFGDVEIEILLCTFHASLSKVSSTYERAFA